MEELKFFRRLYQTDNPDVSVHSFKNGSPQRAQYGRLNDLSKNIEYMVKRGYDLFYTVNTSGSEKRADSDIIRSYSFFIDIDDEYLPDMFPLAPSAIVSREDNKGHHIYWFLSDIQNFNDNSDRDMWSDVQKVLINYYRSDKVIHNPSRIMRVPGSYNYKKKIIDEHNRPLQYQLIHCENKYYTVNEIVLAHSGQEAILRKLYHEFNRLFGSEKLRDGDGRHKKMLQAAFLMNDYGLKKEEVFENLKMLNEVKLEDKYDESKLKALAESIKYADNKNGNKAVEETLQLQRKISLLAEKLKDWYFVENGQFFVDTNKPMKPINEKVFNARFAADTGHVNSAHFCFKHELLKHADQFVYEPDESVVCRIDGEDCINMWVKSDCEEIEPENLRPDIFLDHVDYLFNNSVDRDYFLDYMAHMVQKPKEKIRHALVIIGKQGIGKSVLKIALQNIFGKHNVSSPSNTDLSEKFTGWAKHCQVCFIDEIEQTEKKEFVNKIKPLISEDTITVREMYKGSYTITNYMSIIATTNSTHPILLSGDDRRFFILESDAEQRDSEYYDILFDYCENNAGEILWFLKQRDISHFKAGARPPMTRVKKDMIQYSKPDLQVNIEDMIEEMEAPFNKDLVSISEVYDHFHMYGKNKFVTKNRITLILKEIGGVLIDQQVRLKNGTRYKFWCMRNYTRWNSYIISGEYNNKVRELFDAEANDIEDNKVVFMK